MEYNIGNSIGLRSYEGAVQDEGPSVGHYKIVSPEVIKIVTQKDQFVPEMRKLPESIRAYYKTPNQRRRERNEEFDFEEEWEETLKEMHEVEINTRPKLEKVKEELRLLKEQKFSPVEDIVIKEEKVEECVQSHVLGYVSNYNREDINETLERTVQVMPLPASVELQIDAIYTQHAYEPLAYWKKGVNAYKNKFPSENAYRKFQVQMDRIGNEYHPLMSDGMGMVLWPCEGAIEEASYMEPLTREEIEKFSDLRRESKGRPLIDRKWGWMGKKNTRDHVRKMIYERYRLRRTTNPRIVRRLLRYMYNKVMPIHGFRFRNAWRWTVKHVWQVMREIMCQGMFPAVQRYHGSVLIEESVRTFYRYCLLPTFIDGTKIIGMQGSIDAIQKLELQFDVVDQIKQDYGRWWVILERVRSYLQPWDLLRMRLVSKLWYASSQRQQIAGYGEKAVYLDYEKYMMGEQICDHGKYRYTVEEEDTRLLEDCQDCEIHLSLYIQREKEWYDMMVDNGIIIMSHHVERAIEELKKYYKTPVQFFSMCLIPLSSTEFPLVWPGVCFYLYSQECKLSSWMQAFSDMYFSLVLSYVIEQGGF